MTILVGSGSISQKHRSIDPDPGQYVTDPATLIKIVAFRCRNARGEIVITQGGKSEHLTFSKEKSYYLPRVPRKKQSVRSRNGK
jgi:hypothetical protein